MINTPARGVPKKQIVPLAKFNHRVCVAILNVKKSH
jgi:hypothetical protein